MTDLAIGRVSPFGHPGITAHVQLPQAYRSLSRPSSPLDAKASTVCLIAFDLKFVRVAWLDANPSRTTGVDSSHPVESTRRSVLHHTIHRQLSKSKSAPSRADTLKVMQARSAECGRLLRTFTPNPKVSLLVTPER